VIEQLVMYPHAAQEMYRLFKSTPKEEDEEEHPLLHLLGWSACNGCIW
jgi:hypothetical protein